MVEELKSLLPKKFDRYLEPMVGGGALFFALQPEKSILADINRDLINYYQVLRDDTDQLLQNLRRLKATTDLYYKLRNYRPRLPLAKAIRFAYLNRLCWNGLYRENLKGHFNVPIGSRLPATMWNIYSLKSAATILSKSQLIHAPFEASLVRARPGDFVFLDPPYPRGAYKSLGFNRYSKKIFSLDSHRKLAQCITALTNRKVKVMLTISNTAEIASIYPKHLHRTHAKSMALISCNGSSRHQIKELILRNYRH